MSDTHAFRRDLSSSRGGLCPPQLMLRGEFGRVQAVQSPTLPPSFSVPAPSHLIAFDKCLYWLHIIRCSRGRLRLYYPDHIPHLFSVVHGCHACFCEVRTGPRLYQCNSVMSRGSCWLRDVLVSALDAASAVTANL